MSSIVASAIEDLEDLTTSTANDFGSGVYYDSDEENVEIENSKTKVDKVKVDDFVDENYKNDESKQKITNNLFFSVNTSEDQILKGQFIRGKTDALKFSLKMIDLIIEKHENLASFLFFKLN